MKNFLAKLKVIFEKLKLRWGITSNTQFWIIMLVFAITGMSAVQLRKFVFPLIGVDDSTSTGVRIGLWLLIVFPSYYVFMIVYSYIFGQFDFFWNFMIKKSFGRFGKLFGKKQQKAE
jgi:hypothetical protein